MPAEGLPGMHRSGEGIAVPHNPHPKSESRRPFANAQGWVGPISGTEAMTITLRIEPPISLGPQQSTSPLNLLLMGWELPK